MLTRSRQPKAKGFEPRGSVSKTFVACGLPNPKQAADVKALREAVARGGSGQILLSTIFKFQGSKKPIPNSEDWIVLVDECHRTQEKDLGAFLQATLPDARYFGFTGTPIKKADKDTYARFSEPGETYLDKYGIDDAVRDGATVPILYEGRKTEWSINEAEIDILFDRWFVDLSDEKREKLKQKGVSLALIAKHPERIKLIARDIWEHFKQTCRPDGFKAQIVAIDRESVVLYRLALAEVIAADLAKDGMAEADAAAKADRMIACVFSKSQEDDKPSEDPEVQAVRAELRAHYLDADGEKATKKAFKGVGDEPSFLIVCDKLLTGFDAPNEHVMYLDKPLREHGLLQAIARTNRTCSVKRPDGSTVDKPHGRIVDYIGVTQHLDDALSSYRADDVQNALRDLDLLRRDLRKTHAEFMRQRRLLGLDGMEEKSAAYAVEKLVADGREDDWFELQRLCRHFVRTYGDLSPDPAILDFTEDMKWAATFLRLAQQAITKDESLDHLTYSGKIRDMLEEHVRATGLTTTVRLRNITDPDFKEDFQTEEMSDEELHAAFVRKSVELKRVTRELVDKNPAQYGRFSERVLEIIRRFEEGQIAAAEGLKDFEDLTGGIATEAGAHDELGMDERAFAILRIIEPHAPDAEHMPIVVNGFPVGSLCVLDSQPKAYDPVFARQLERLAKIVGDDLANRHQVRSLRQSLLASADALIDCDEHGVITDWSAGAERLFGFARAEALGQRINIIIPPDRAEAHDRGFEHWRKSGAARLERRIELLAQRKDGSPVDIELWMSVTHIHGVRHIHLNVRDITERKQNAAELLAAKVEAEAANEAKSTFLANMSHELRTPMNGVVAVADLLARTGLNRHQSELVSIIQSSSGQLLRLVGDILDLSRIESGEMVLVSSPMSLRDLIREVTGGLEVAASEKHLSLSVSIDPAVSEQVEGDATRLKQVLTNLVSNAIKFTESGSVTVTVRRAGEDVRFEVHDTGMGFSEEQRAVIFERFQQADGSITRKFGGTGLGLAICRELVAVMGGELDCCGSTGEGASFWFTLPLRPVATVAAPVENAAEVHTINSRALVVDDNVTNRRVAELLLQSVGTHVVSVEDGQQAVDAFRRERYDVILMDMMMPVMDGLAATETIRQIEAEQRLRHTPIIMLTASSLPEHITASMDAGADLHLLKPINAAALFDALNVVGNAESDENERPDAHADG